MAVLIGSDSLGSNGSYEFEVPQQRVLCWAPAVPGHGIQPGSALLMATTFAKFLGSLRQLSASPNVLIQPYICIYVYVYVHVHMYVYKYVHEYICICAYAELDGSHIIGVFSMVSGLGSLKG